MGIYIFIVVICLLFMFFGYSGNNKVFKEIKKQNEYIMALETDKDELEEKIEKLKNQQAEAKKDIEILGHHYIADSVKWIAHHSENIEDAEEKINALYSFCEKHGVTFAKEQKYKFRYDLKHEINENA
jgi:peptidoglycan hydrolase CwlO-like protein